MNRKQIRKEFFVMPYFLLKMPFLSQKTSNVKTMQIQLQTSVHNLHLYGANWMKNKGYCGESQT